jgi:uncharacterized protein YtpQ (UPF0354 family)
LRGKLKSNFRDKLNEAKSKIMENGIISETELFYVLDVGIQKFQWIKKALLEDRDFVYQNGFFSLRQLAPQKTIEEFESR